MGSGAKMKIGPVITLLNLSLLLLVSLFIRAPLYVGLEGICPPPVTSRWACGHYHPFFRMSSLTLNTCILKSTLLTLEPLVSFKIRKFKQICVIRTN